VRRAAGLALVALVAACTQGGGIVDGDAGARVDATDDGSTTPPPPKSEPGRHDVQVTSSRRMIPGPGFPAETPAQSSNSNLDVIRHDGRVYLASTRRTCSGTTARRTSSAAAT
jgi:hypothetical protein